MKYLIPPKFSLILILGSVTACAPLADIRLNRPDEKPPSVSYEIPYTVAPLDEIQLLYRNGHTVTLSVTVEDNLLFPIDHGRALHAVGKDPEEVEREIKKRDSDVVSVKFHEFKGSRISVTGEVNIQTNFDLQDAPIRVLDAIASAGGFTPLADKSSVRLIRHNSGTIQVFHLNMHDVETGRSDLQNMLLEPGDRIFVPKSFL